jgi:hypothetical protein
VRIPDVLQAAHLNLDEPAEVREESRRIVIEPVRCKESLSVRGACYGGHMTNKRALTSSSLPSLLVPEDEDASTEGGRHNQQQERRRVRLSAIGLRCVTSMDWSTLRADDTATKIVCCRYFAGPTRNAGAFVLCASAVAKCRRERMLPPDGSSMRLEGHVISPILL